MIPQLIIDQETQAQYEIDHNQENGSPQELGRGATAVVYLAKLKEGNRNSKEVANEVAIKVAFAGLSASTREDFRAEQKKIATLREKTTYVPWAHVGQDPANSETDILVIERIPEEWELTEITRKTGGRLSEELALEAGNQYAQVLLVLHDLKMTMCGDRKASDFHWNAENRRLIVLDWNRAQYLPTEETLESRSLIRQDIRIFGLFWAQLILGRRSIYALPEPDDTTDPDWEKLSFGTRVVLFRALSKSDAIPEYKTADRLAEDLRKQWRLFQDESRDPQSWLKEAMDSKSGEIQAVLRVGAIADWFVNAAIYVNKPPKLTTEQKKKAQELYQWSSEEIAKARKEKRQAIDRVQENIGRGYYSDAASAALTGIKEVAENEPEDALVRLRMRRWLSVANLANKINEFGKSAKSTTSELVTALSDWQQMESASLQSRQQERDALYLVQQRLESALKGYELEVQTALRSEIRSVLLELDFRIASANVAVEEQERGKHTEQAEIFSQQALNAWTELKTDIPYSDDLTTCFAASLGFAARVQRVEDIFTQADVWPPQVADEIKWALAFYDNYLHGEEKETRKLLAMIDTIAENMQGNVEQRNEYNAFQLARSLIVPKDRVDLKTKVEALITQSAREHIEWIRMNGKWQDELEQAEKLCQALGETLNPDDRLALWRGLLNDSSNFSATDFLKGEPGSESEKLLGETIRFGVELFDRRIPDNGELTMTAIKTLRDAKRMQDIVTQQRTELEALEAENETIKESVQALIAQNRSLVQGMASQNQALEQARQTVVEAVDQAKKILGQVDSKEISNSLSAGNELNAELRALAEQLAQKQDELSIVIKTAKEPKQKALAQVDAWSHLTQEMSDATSRLKEYAAAVDGISPEHKQAVQDAKPSFDQVLLQIFVTKGLAAVRALSDPEEIKKEYLSHAEKIDRKSPAVTVLQRAITWLAPQNLDLLRKWKTALDARELERAETARVNLYRNAMKECLDSWLVAEMNESHLLLRKGFLEDHKDEVAAPDITRVAFVRRAAELLRDSDLNNLGEAIRQYEQSSDLSVLDMELVSTWRNRLEQASQARQKIYNTIAKWLKHGSGDAVKRANQLLTEVLTGSTDEVFFAVYPEWERAFRVLVSINPDYSALDEPAREKAVVGKRLMSIAVK